VRVPFSWYRSPHNSHLGRAYCVRTVYSRIRYEIEPDLLVKQIQIREIEPLPALFATSITKEVFGIPHPHPHHLFSVPDPRVVLSSRVSIPRVRVSLSGRSIT
jgi:hypothetical protein